MSTRKPQPQRPKRPMVADLAGHHLDEAIGIARTVLDENGTYPGHVDDAAAALTAIADWAQRHSIDQVGDLTGDQATAMLLDVAGTDSLQPLDPSASERLHLHRNTLSLIRFLVLLTRPSAITRRSDRPANDTIAAGLPQIGPRTGYRVRPLRDDEIVLARMLTLLDLNEDAPLVPVHNYVLSEAGIAPMSISRAEVEHLVWSEDGDPVAINTKGLHKRGQRFLPFDDWQQHILTTTLPAYRTSGRTHLAYTGEQPGTKDACASTGPTLARFLRRAGITGRDVSPGSVHFWRPDHILQHQNDLIAATEIAGAAPDRLLKNLHYTLDEISVHRGIATLVTLDARPNTYVPAGQVRSLGRWTDDDNRPGILKPAA